MAYPNSPVVYAPVVGVTSVQVIGVNMSRIRMHFFNPNFGTQQIIWLTPAQDINNVAVAAVANQSIPLLPGGLYVVDSPKGGRIPSAWNAIASIPAQQLTIIEFLQQGEP